MGRCLSKLHRQESERRGGAPLSCAPCPHSRSIFPSAVEANGFYVAFIHSPRVPIKAAPDHNQSRLFLHLRACKTAKEKTVDNLQKAFCAGPEKALVCFSSALGVWKTPS